MIEEETGFSLLWYISTVIALALTPRPVPPPLDPPAQPATHGGGLSSPVTQCGGRLPFVVPAVLVDVVVVGRRGVVAPGATVGTPLLPGTGWPARGGAAVVSVGS